MRTVGLLVKQDESTGGKLGRFDKIFSQIGLNVSLQRLQFYSPLAIDRTIGWLLTVNQFDDMIIDPGVLGAFRREIQRGYIRKV